MPDIAPDFRSDKSDSLEGSGIARARYDSFHNAVDDDVWADIYFARKAAGWPDRAPLTQEEIDLHVPNEVLEEINDRVLEDSELLGFWLAWHLAGGFSKLQEAGWHRTTIHRKMRRFRARYGEHPDEFSLPWLRLDLPKAWRAALVEKMHPEPYDEREEVEEPDEAFIPPWEDRD